MLVKKRDDSGRAIVKARIKNLRLVWNMGGMASDVVDESEVVQSCQQLLEGSDVQFSIAPDGKISDFPDASEAQGIPDITRLCVETLLEALESSLVELPDEPMTTGKSWTNEDTKGRKGRLGRYVERTTTSTFEGLFTRTDGPEDRLAVINSDTRELTTVTTNDGGHDVTKRTAAVLRYNVTRGFPAEVEVTTTRVDGPSVSNVRLRARWAKRAASASAAPSTPSPAAPEAKRFDDPCAPDYVGPEICADNGGGGGADDFADVEAVAPGGTPGAPPAPADGGNADEAAPAPAPTPTPDE